MIKTVGFVEFQNETVVITDPCYLLHPLEPDKENELWKYCEYGENLGNLGMRKYVTASTIYGDWSCTVFEMSTNKVLGVFCADAGMVCVAKLDEILKFNPNWLDWLKEHEHCATLIPEFTGKVAIIHADKKYEKECWEYGRECWVEGRGNINFISKQTGL